MSTTIPAMQRYMERLLQEERVKNLLARSIFRTPWLDEMPGPPTNAGGRSYGSRHIQIPVWMLADPEEARATVRHELAHCIHCKLFMLNKSDHGEEFKRILRIISPRKWRADLRWHETPKLAVARMQWVKKSLPRRARRRRVSGV